MQQKRVIQANITFRIDLLSRKGLCNQNAQASLYKIHLFFQLNNNNSILCFRAVFLYIAFQ